MTLEMCEMQLVEMLAALDEAGAGTSRSACYLAMALDSMGDARTDVAARSLSSGTADRSRQVSA
jgi:hypothetical protein